MPSTIFKISIQIYWKKSNESGEVNPNGMLKAIAKKRNLLKADNELDVKRAAELFLTELRHGKLGRLTLERVNEESESLSE